MPYMIVKDGDKWCVHLQNEDKTPGETVKCHPSEAEAKAHMSALYASVADAKAIGIRFGPASAIKAVEDGDNWTLEVLGVPFGSRDHKDFDGEWFTPNTDIMLKVGESRPALYMHGKTPRGERQEHPEVIGVATYIGVREDGHWFKVVLDKAKTFAKRIWTAAKRGLARASSGAIAHLFRGDGTGEIGVWPIGELSLIDTGQGREPANWDAVAMPIKAVFDDAGLEMPESFVEGDEPKTDEKAEEEASVEQIISEEIDMTPFVVASAAGAAVAHVKGREEQWTRKNERPLP